jgi:hypothetical protein
VNYVLRIYFDGYLNYVMPSTDPFNNLSIYLCDLGYSTGKSSLFYDMGRYDYSENAILIPATGFGETNPQFRNLHVISSYIVNN